MCARCLPCQVVEHIVRVMCGARRWHRAGSGWSHAVPSTTCLSSEHVVHRNQSWSYGLSAGSVSPL
jgi:hypothetical protein